MASSPPRRSLHSQQIGLLLFIYRYSIIIIIIIIITEPEKAVKIVWRKLQVEPNNFAKIIT
jgi:hypothetical protein